jgi:hypothetical protein
LPRRIPACYECNNGLSKDEELFRIFAASGMAYESNTGNRIWNEKIRSALQGRRPGLKPLIKSMAKPIVILNKAGLLLGTALILEVDPAPINRVIRKIAKGLYYLDTGKVLSSKVEILVEYENEKPERFFTPPLDDAIRSAKEVRLGRGEVIYWRNTIKDNPEESLTWIKFYEDKTFLICTSRK